MASSFRSTVGAGCCSVLTCVLLMVFSFARESKERWSGFDDVHSAAEAAKGLSELDADGASAEDRERHWQLRRNRCLAIGPEVDGVEAGYRRDRRGAAVGDHHGAARDELLASNRDR